MKRLPLLLILPAIGGLIVFAWRSQVGASRARESAEDAVVAEQRAPARSLEEMGRLVDAADSESRQAVEADDPPPNGLAEAAASLTLENKLNKFVPAGTQSVPSESGASILERINALSAAHGKSERANKEQRIALRERFLDLHPDDPDALWQLEALLAENLGTQPALALDSLERYGGRISAQPWQIDDLRANALIRNQRFDEGRAAYERVIRSAPDESDRATARFFAALSYMDEGRYDEARSRFEALIAQYGNDPAPEIVNTVNGAKLQLQKIAEHAQQK